MSGRRIVVRGRHGSATTPGSSRTLPATVAKRDPKLLDPPALAGARPERQVDRLAELARKVAALPAQRRQMHPQTARGLAGGPASEPG